MKKQIIDYITIIQDSALLLWKNKLLLIFGLILTLTGGNFNTNQDARESLSSEEIIAEASSFFSQWNGTTLFLILIFIIFITILIIILNLSSKIALISSTNKLLKNKGFSIIKEFKSSKKYFVKIFQVNLLVTIVLLLLLTLLAIPIVILFILANTPTLVFILIAAGALIFIPAALLAYFMLTFSQFYIIKNKLSVKESLKNSYSLVNVHLRSVILMSLSILAFEIILSVAVTIALALPVTLAFFINGAFSIALGVLTIVLFLLISSSLIVIKSISWLKFFTQIARDDSTVPETSTETKKETSLEKLEEVSVIKE
ncbi:hypothetical protein ACFL08_02300 [Patescibacteria group bacterium]